MSLLTTLPHDPLLDLDPWVGQRQCTFRFALVNGLTDAPLGDITPLRGASLTHDTSRTIKRQLSLNLGVADTAAVNPVTDRIDLFMEFPNGTSYPLGRYMFTDASRQVFTSGKLASMALNDEMFLVDQEISKGISGLLAVAGIAVRRPVAEMLEVVLAELPVSWVAEACPFVTGESWGIGTGRGQIIESLAVSGDFFSPWFGNDKKLHFIRTFFPKERVPDFNFDVGNKVIREPIVETDDLLTAPNRFIVISNGAIDPETEVVGTYDITPSAPHSIQNRGFIIAQTSDLQLSNQAQATAVARGLGIRQTVFERVSLTTAPDPRHDSYNVIHWQGDHWLELSWSMALTEGGVMNHLLRRAYTP